ARVGGASRAVAPAVVLVRPKAPENVGAAARAMKNFGLTRLILVAPRCRIDRRAHALASHAGDVLDAARTVEALPEALSGVAWAVGTSARERASEAVRDLSVDDALLRLPDEAGALVFGPEDHGLANEELDRCQAVVRIPTAAYASINLAQAVNLLAFRWFTLRRVEERPTPQAERADREQMERMYEQLAALWHRIGYTDVQRETATLRLYRGFLDRADLTPRELAAVRGLWAQTEWALDRAFEGLTLEGRKGPKPSR
ncbi:MAG: RNA methyltransferase, partial [Trueperaceae bacterium]